MTEGKVSESREGLSLQTLVVAAIASGIAAVVVSRFWKDGTVFAAAMTPVIVSIMKELLQRPMESEIVKRSASRVSEVAVAPAKRVASGSGSAVRGRRFARNGGESPVQTAAPPERGGNGDRNGSTTRGGEVVHAAPRRDYSSGGAAGPRRRRFGKVHLRVAIVTGLLAFAIAAVVLTVPELIFGGAVGSKDRTTIFGGGDRSSSDENKDGDKRDNEDESDSNSPQDQQQDSGETEPDAPSGDTQPDEPSSDGGSEPEPAPEEPPSSGSEPAPDSGGGGSPAPETPVPAPAVP